MVQVLFPLFVFHLDSKYRIGDRSDKKKNIYSIHYYRLNTTEVMEYNIKVELLLRWWTALV